MDCNCQNYNHPNHKDKPCKEKGDLNEGGLCPTCANLRES